MPRRKRLPPGIIATATGYRVHIAASGRRHFKRFPPTATNKEMLAWRERIKGRHTQRAPARGTLADDARRYLRAVAAMPTIADRTRDVEAWLVRFGHRSRASLEPSEIAAQLHEWRQALAASTVNHRRTALSHLYAVLDGRSAYNPVRETPAFKQPDPEPRGVPLATVCTILNQLEPTKSKARLAVLAWTGMRPVELMRMQPAHVALERAECWVTTAKGGRGRYVALSAEGVWAWELYIATDAWGPWSHANVRKKLLEACGAAELPPIRIYDLRHSLGSALREAGADLADVAAHLGHSTTALTARYAPTVPEKLREAVARL